MITGQRADLDLGVRGGYQKRGVGGDSGGLDVVREHGGARCAPVEQLPCTDSHTCAIQKPASEKHADSFSAHRFSRKHLVLRSVDLAQAAHVPRLEVAEDLD
ncbi:hypothetical protein BDZ91DRAFT_738231, partial [Kalaharituber pfeilii]